jgi:hypothetical protein
VRAFVRLYPHGLSYRKNLISIRRGQHGEDNHMITATVRYKLPSHIDYAACREHFHKIAPGFREVKGLISKHFIWSESGWAGGVYQWERIEDAKAFYTGPWLDGIVQRYGMKPQIDFYEVFAVTDNARGKVELFKETLAAAK